MTRRNVKLGERFPEEKTLQSPLSSGVVEDREFVERELKYEREIHRGIEPTEAAFPRKQLLGRNGSGLSVTRRNSPSPKFGSGVVNLRKILHRVYAQVGELRKICDAGGERIVCIVDAGTEDNPMHAEIFLKLEGAQCGSMEGRLRILRAFGGRTKQERNEQTSAEET